MALLVNLFANILVWHEHRVHANLGVVAHGLPRLFLDTRLLSWGKVERLPPPQLTDTVCLHKQVLKCRDHKTGEVCAIKVIRNQKRFHKQALIEMRILEHLRNQVHPCGPHPHFAAQHHAVWHQMWEWSEVGGGGGLGCVVVPSPSFCTTMWFPCGFKCS